LSGKEMEAMTECVYENVDEMLEQLISETKDILNKEDISPDSTLTEIGIDSLNVIELIVACEQIYTKVTRPEELQFDEFTTIQDLHSQLIELSSDW
jgi:acyl carrier protein